MKWIPGHNLLQAGIKAGAHGLGLNLPRLIADKANPKSKQLIHDPKHAALTHLITPGGDVLIAKNFAVGSLEWLKPIQADSHNGTRPSSASNAHAAVL